MQRIKIITPDPIVETLLTLLAERLPEPEESAVLLDAAWLHRIGEFTGGKVIAFTASADPAYLTAAQEAGADGFWYMQPFADAFACVLAGEPVFPDHAPVVKLGKAFSSDFTRRELDVLRHISAGQSDAQIGAALNITVSTVKHHIQQLRIKTGFANRTQLAVEAVRSGLIGG